jgi:hypothetical protein
MSPAFPMVRTTVRCLVAAFVLTACPAGALADGSRLERADALFQEGRAAVRQGNWELGCPKFEESLRLDAAPGTRINLGECEERTGHLVRALELYQQAASELANDDRRMPLAKQRAEAVGTRIPRLVVPQGARVRIDGRLDAQGAEEVRLDPGRHTIVILARGAERTIVVTLVEKERKELDPDAPAVPAVTSSRRTVGFALGGIGLAGIATGLVLGALTIHQKSVVDAHCDASNACDRAGLDAKSEGRTLSTVSTAAFAVGVATLAAGIYFFVTAPHADAALGSFEPSNGVIHGRF